MKHGHLLVVDDEPALRTLFQTILEMYGYTSDTAGNGRDAQTKLARESYDTVLLDYMMPGENGLTVLRHIQQRYPSLPVVMFTGHTDEKVAEQALALGARACLYKPFELAKLAETLNAMVGTVESKQPVST